MKQHLVTTLAGLAAASIAMPAAEVSLNGHHFTLPDGFTIELVAGPDLVPRPVSASFGPDGALYVTDSSGLNLPPSEQIKDPKSRLLRLEDADGDGRFDRSIVFADRVMFPQGCLWHAGSVYVAGPPSIWKFTDSDGDGTAESREEWYKGEVLTGCANDVHGPYLGPEGMLYWTKGAFARLDLKDHRGQPINDRCAHVFRARPDGSALEVVISGGMDNPVEVAFTPEGEPIIISTFIDLSRPGRRDGLAHAVYGGVFPKVNDVVDEPMVRRTGDLLPAMTHFGPAAACALMRYVGDGLGSEYRDNLFATLFNLRKVTRHILQPQGATYSTADSDFLVSDHPDFRPTDVLQDADGSLLIVDTGGWYKLCCPSSQLAKADVLGGIYRILRAKPAPQKESSRTADASARERLTQPPPYAETAEAQLKRLALEASPASAGRLRDALSLHTPNVTGSPRSARIVRIAAEGLGRMRDRDAVPFLFEALSAGVSDRFLEHSLIYALIEVGDAAALRPYLQSQDPVLHSSALLALEQIESGGLTSDHVAPLLTASSDRSRRIAHWIARRHPEWSAAIVQQARAQLSAPAFTGAGEGWHALLTLLARNDAGQRFLAEVGTAPGFNTPARAAALDAMAESGVKRLPSGWKPALLNALGRSEPEELRFAAIRTVQALPLSREGDPQITELLHTIARDPSAPRNHRLEAIAALPNGTSLSDGEFAVLRSSLSQTGPPSERTAAANALGRLSASPHQLDALTQDLPAAGPLELPRLLGAFSPGGDDPLGRKLLDALSQSKAIRSLRPEDWKPAFARFPEPIREEAETLLLSSPADEFQNRQHLDALLAQLGQLDGRIREGQAIFNSTKAACSSCHRLGYLGGTVGPDLTSIGTVRTERDLLEALVYPSASFVRSYEPWIAATTDGEEYSGVLRRETADEVVLATGPDTEIRIARSNLSELRQGSVSTMPAGLDSQFTHQELADLIAFLKNTRWGVN
jgi:putative membrane-bound dehydrogenase-like protein